MIQFDVFAMIIYPIGLVGWLFVWHYLVGFSLLRKMKLLYIPFLGAPFVFILNFILSFFAAIPSYQTEGFLYPFVENNAKTVALLSLAIAVFVVLRIGAGQLDQSRPRIKLFLYLILWAFLISALGTLPLYWVPTEKYWLTALRHLKSVPYFYSLFILGAGIVVFIYETGYKRSDMQEIEDAIIYDDQGNGGRGF